MRSRVEVEEGAVELILHVVLVVDAEGMVVGGGAVEGVNAS